VEQVAATSRYLAVEFRRRRSRTGSVRCPGWLAATAARRCRQGWDT